MKLSFKQWRKGNVPKIGKYLLYAVGEIGLIIIGILIAVNVNERQTEKQNQILRCHYLKELKFAIVHDIKDVEINLDAFKIWNPKIKELLIALDQQDLANLDSIDDKVNTLDDYVTFLQQSKSKIEELKYAPVNLIQNRALKHKLLIYQDTKISFLLEQQRRFNQHNEKVEDYFLQKKNFTSLELEKDEYFYQLTHMKHEKHEVMKAHYEGLLQELLELMELIETELGNSCEAQNE